MKIKDGFVLEEVGGSYIAVAVGERADNFSAMIRMNGTGAFLWNIMSEADVTREQLADKMLEAYEVDRETALAGIIAFENKLRDAGILE